MPLTSPSLRLQELGMRGVLPPAFDDWFLQCVNRDAQQRFGSAGAAIEALANVFGIGGQRPSFADAAQPVALVASAKPALSVTHTFAAHGSGAAAAVSDVGLRGQATDAAMLMSGNAGTKRRRGIVPGLVAVAAIGALAGGAFYIFSRAPAVEAQPGSELAHSAAADVELKPAVPIVEATASAAPIAAPPLASASAAEAAPAAPSPPATARPAPAVRKRPAPTRATSATAKSTTTSPVRTNTKSEIFDER
jgi:hypothetical protein